MAATSIRHCVSPVVQIAIMSTLCALSLARALSSPYLVPRFSIIWGSEHDILVRPRVVIQATRGIKAWGGTQVTVIVAHAKQVLALGLDAQNVAAAGGGTVFAASHPGNAGWLRDGVAVSRGVLCASPRMLVHFILGVFNALGCNGCSNSFILVR